MTSFENLSASQKFRAALHRDIQAICQETCHYLGLEVSKYAVELVAELVFKKLSVYGTDLEAFAKACGNCTMGIAIAYVGNPLNVYRHAKRTSINTEDVKLLVRRCPSLKAHLNKLAQATPNSKEKKRKSKPAVPQETVRRESLIQTAKQAEAEITAPAINEDAEMFQEPELVDCVDLTLN